MEVGKPSSTQVRSWTKKAKTDVGFLTLEQGARKSKERIRASRMKGMDPRKEGQEKRG